MNLEEDLKIDPEALDVELMRQPLLEARYGKQAAQAEDRARRADEKVKVVRSGLIKQILEENDKKPSDTVIEAIYRTHPDHQQAKAEWLDAKEEADACQQAMWAAKGRGDKVEGLIKLFLAQYFIGPTVPRDLPAEWKNRVENRKQEALRGRVAERQPRREVRG